MTRSKSAILALAILLVAASVFAHEPSKSYLNLTLDSNELSGQWDIRLRDLQLVVPLDLDTDGIVTFEKLHARYPAIATYALAHLKISVNGQSAILSVTNTEPEVGEFADGSYVRLPLVINSPAKNPESLAINYQLFFDTNSLHRGLLRLEANDIVRSAVFTPDDRSQEFQLHTASPGRQFLAFLREGVFLFIAAGM